MQLRHFVSASSVVLAGWLVVTFFSVTPSQRYPKLDKYPTTSAFLPAAPRAEQVAGVSVSQ